MLKVGLIIIIWLSSTVSGVVLPQMGKNKINVVVTPLVEFKHKSATGKGIGKKIYDDHPSLHHPPNRADLLISEKSGLPEDSTMKPFSVMDAINSRPAKFPTAKPSARRDAKPTAKPSAMPLRLPTSAMPVRLPTAKPSAMPLRLPTAKPSALSVRSPTMSPVPMPLRLPTMEPTVRPPPTAVPTWIHPTAAITTAPTRSPTAPPSAGPSLLDSELGLPRHYGVQVVPTGHSVSVENWHSNGDITVVGGVSHMSWAYFNETFEYPFVVKFVERRVLASATAVLNFCWHWDPRNLDQFTSCLNLYPSGYAVMQTGFGYYAGSYDGVGDIPSSTANNKHATILSLGHGLYGVIPFTDSNNKLVVNWTSLSWSQNATHLNIGGFVNGINPTYWLLGFIVNTFTPDGTWQGNVIVSRTWNNDYNELYSTGSLANEHVNQSQFMLRATSHGVEASVDMRMFPSSVTMFSISLYVIGYTSALGWQAGTFNFAVERSSCPSSLTSPVVWNEDGNPSDFASSHAVFSAHAAHLSREWTVQVHRNYSNIYVNSQLQTTVVNPLSTNLRRPLAVACLRVAANAATDNTTMISNVSFYGTSIRHDTTASIFKIEQCSLPASSMRGPKYTFVTPTGPDVVGLPSNDDVKLAMCPLYDALESLYGHSFNIDPLVTVWSDVGGGVNAGDSGIFVPDWGFGIIYVTYHEMSHWTKCVGGNCDYGTYQWLWEGHASYMGQQARNKLLGLPAFTFFPCLWFPDEFVPNGDLDQPLSTIGLINELQYYKAEMFLFLLSDVVGYDVMMSVISNNYQTDVTSNSFIARIEAASGKDLSAWLPGWLNPGTYNSSVIAAGAYFKDTDGDGLIDFQEIMRGTNYSLADTDSDGYSDYWELANDYNPLLASSKPVAHLDWIVDGLPHDYPHNVSEAIWYHDSTAPLKTKSVKCKRIGDTDNIQCAIWNFPNATGTIHRRFAGFQGGATMIVSCIGSNPYSGLSVTMDGVGGIHYIYNNVGRPELKVSISTFSFRETDAGAEFSLTVPGRNIWIYFSYVDPVDGLRIHIPY